MRACGQLKNVLTETALFVGHRPRLALLGVTRPERLFSWQCTLLRGADINTCCSPSRATAQGGSRTAIRTELHSSRASQLTLHMHHPVFSKLQLKTYTNITSQEKNAHVTAPCCHTFFVNESYAVVTRHASYCVQDTELPFITPCMWQ